MNHISTIGSPHLHNMEYEKHNCVILEESEESEEYNV